MPKSLSRSNLAVLANLTNWQTLPRAKITRQPVEPRAAEPCFCQADSCQSTNQAIEKNFLRRIDLGSGPVDRKKRSAIYLGKSLELARTGRPLYFEGVG